jgi:hypothetical protein
MRQDDAIGQQSADGDGLGRDGRGRVLDIDEQVTAEWPPSCAGKKVSAACGAHLAPRVAREFSRSVSVGEVVDTDN